MSRKRPLRLIGAWRMKMGTSKNVTQLLAMFYVVALFAASSAAQPRLMSLEEYERETKTDFLNITASWAEDRSFIIQAIEETHETVSIYDVKLISVKVKTVDNVKAVMLDNDDKPLNIKWVEVIFRFLWHDKSHKDGFTDICFRHGSNMELLECRITETRARKTNKETFRNFVSKLREHFRPHICALCRKEVIEFMAWPVNVNGLGLRALCDDCMQKYKKSNFFKQVFLEFEMLRGPAY